MKLPAEALVLLDRVLELLPRDVHVHGWPMGDYRGPVLSDHRASKAKMSEEIPTWTVGLSNGSYLEWIDTRWRWVRYIQGFQEVVWEWIGEEMRQ